MIPVAALVAAFTLRASPAVARPPPADAAALARSAARTGLAAKAPPEAGAPLETERDALRALAAVAAGEPAVEEVQDAAARTAERQVSEAEGFARRARTAALLPRLTVEVRRDERTSRIVGLQTAGEVDYQHLTPGSSISISATWDLGGLVAARGELAGAQAEAERVRRRTEAVRRATVLYYERRRERLALLLEPPDGALERAEAELRVDRLGAELDALTGGLLSGRRQ
jgi:hypothetical protein